MPLPPARPRTPPSIDHALAVASRSALFTRMLDDVLREGWVLDLARIGRPRGVTKGPHLIAIEPEPPGPFVGRLVLAVALAHALPAGLPIADPGDKSFVHANAVAYLKWDGEARLDAATARDEILAAGGPDIGGPGLRGGQLHFYDGFVRGILTRARRSSILACRWTAWKRKTSSACTSRASPRT
jgi:hypothetical protein